MAIALPLHTTGRRTSIPASWVRGHDPTPRRAAPDASAANSVASRTVLDILRVAFADELEGQCLPDDQLVTWLHNNDNTRAAVPS